MAQRSFKHDIFIEADPKAVYNFLAAQVNHQEIHPLIVSITPLPDQANKPGTKFYQIKDRLELKVFKWKWKWAINYRSAVTPQKDGELLLEAFQPMLYLRNLTRCIPEAGGTHLYEDVTVQTPGILMGYAFGQAERSHREMFEALKRYEGFKTL